MGMRNPKIIAQVKASFLTLCQQYESAGVLLSALARCESEEQTLEVMKRILAQHHEVGEQMKTLGAAIDLLGGVSVLTGQDQGVRIVSGTRNELKRQGINVPGRKDGHRGE